MITKSPTTVLVIGATGMLGNAMIRVFAEKDQFIVYGSSRSRAYYNRFSEAIRPRLISDVDVENVDSLSKLLLEIKPQVVINCVGLVKQLAEANDPLAALPINAIFPHRLARLCDLGGARMIHVSTDCVFDGAKGNYTELDRPNADDLYGRSKLLGEVEADNVVTLRTSIIGHELGSARGLISWFLSQQETGVVKGFTRAIFSGLPTVELARLIRDVVVPDSSFRGVYHVSADPISKYDLLKLVAEIYGLLIKIEPDDYLAIDRSLDSTKFRARTGYRPPRWPDLVRAMHAFG